MVLIKALQAFGVELDFKSLSFVRAAIGDNQPQNSSYDYFALYIKSPWNWIDISRIVLWFYFIVGISETERQPPPVVCS